MELVIAGFYGNGATAVAQLLRRAGLFVAGDLTGVPRVSEADPSAASSSVVAVHTGILEDNGSDWTFNEVAPFYIGKERWRELSAFATARQTEHTAWGFHDPVASPFLGAWKYLLPDARFLIVYRDPRVCERHLSSVVIDQIGESSSEVPSHRRIRLEREYHKMWDVHARYAIAFARAHLADCLVLPYERISAGYPLIAAMNLRWGPGLAAISPERAIDPTALLDPDLSVSVDADQLGARVAETWRSLEELANMTDPRP